MSTRQKKNIETEKDYISKDATGNRKWRIIPGIMQRFFKKKRILKQNCLSQRRARKIINGSVPLFQALASESIEVSNQC